MEQFQVVYELLLPASTLISDFSSLYAYSFCKMWLPLHLFKTLRLFRTLEYFEKSRLLKNRSKNLQYQFSTNLAKNRSKNQRKRHRKLSLKSIEKLTLNETRLKGLSVFDRAIFMIITSSRQ